MPGTATFDSTAPAARESEASRAGARGSLTIVIPCYHEADAIPELAVRLHAFHADEGRRRQLDFVFVDDGSADATHDLLVLHCADLPSRILRHPQNLGLTAALATGSRAATGALVGWFDADLTYAPDVLAQLARAVDGGASIATASCHHPLGRMEGVPPFRAMLSRLASRLYRVASGAPLHTFTCMVRVHRRDVLATLPLSAPGFLGVAESLLAAIAAGREVVEVPATLRARQRGASKMRVVRAGLAHLRLMFAALQQRIRAGRPAVR